MRPRSRRLKTSRAAISLLAALSILVSVVLGGQRYFYCAAMHEVSLGSCCTGDSAAPAHDDSSGGPTVERRACCVEEHFAPQLPTALGSSGEVVLRAPLAALLPAPVSPVVTLHVDARVRALSRAGPGEPTPRDHRLRTLFSLS